MDTGLFVAKARPERVSVQRNCTTECTSMVTHLSSTATIRDHWTVDAWFAVLPAVCCPPWPTEVCTVLMCCTRSPPLQALIHGLNRHYYSIGINYR